MELINEFDVSVPVDTAWNVLTDVERIAPCLPGAQLQEIEGDEYRGVVKVKVGPIQAQYKGKATFVERDDTAHRAVLEATGRDTRGQGNASATITAQLEPSAAGTHVTVTTDLTVTGKVAQFGRGVMADVSAKLLGQFVDNLEQTVLADAATASAPVVEPTAPSPAAAEPSTSGPSETEPSSPSPATPAAEPATGVRRIDQPEPEAIDLLEHAGSPVMKRVVPALGVAVAALIVWRIVRRRRR
ncbi:MAG: carbon monoxide dehydrogenase [Acidimicrobiia bacterium]|nr:carbon monoxide dehydrogenase [Acidimicrobiia bacterium]